MRTFTVEIPAALPRALTANASRFQHFGSKTAIKNELQRTAYLCAIDARNRTPDFKPFTGPVQFDWTIVVKSFRDVKDDDNALAALKYVRDTMQSVADQLPDDANPLELRYKHIAWAMDRAGIILNDRLVKYSHVNWLIDKPTAPKISLTIIELPLVTITDGLASGRIQSA